MNKLLLRKKALTVFIAAFFVLCFSYCSIADDAVDNIDEDNYQNESAMDLSETVREQEIDVMADNLVIDEAYYKSMQIELPEKIVSEDREESEPEILTEEQVITSLLAPDIQEKRIDLDFDEVQLGDIFMTVGKAGGINIMLDPNYKNYQLDLHLDQVLISEAFILIANAYDLGFKPVEGSLFVTSREKIKEENLVSRVIKLRNIRAADAKSMVEDMIEKVNYSEEINSLIVVGTREELVKVNKIIKIIDVPQPQVILEAMIIEVNKDALKELGIDWSDQIALSYQETDRPVDFSDPEAAAKNVLGISSMQRNAIQFSTIIKMLETQNKAKVLSNPRVTTLNDKEAEIFVGDRVPFTVTTVTGGVAETEVRWEEPGIRLKITPSIIEEDFVVIKVQPEVSYIFSWRGTDDQYPWVKKREATAYVRVRDRHPFVLGGLLNQEDKKNLYKVPMLGDVPLLGNLFSYEKHIVLDTELVITITPTIVHGY